ncbi:MAG: hypothetical protein GWP91_14765 [Rhodobacterales bacterium]|nr:hypothetical protein [Rhodobacterales bacterium]
MRGYLDDFAKATPPQWDQAVASSAVANSRFSVQTLAVGLAIAAALVLAVVVQVPSGRASAGFSDDRAVALTRDFKAVHTTLIDVDELSRSEQDERHRAVMADKSLAFEAAEEAWQLLAEEEDPERALVGLIGLGELYQSMGQALREFDQPTYLTDAQSEVYTRALEGKAIAMDERAVEVLEEAREIAVDEDFGADLEVLDEWLDELEQGLDDAAAARQAERDAAAAVVGERRGIELAMPTSGDASTLKAEIDRLGAAVRACDQLDGEQVMALTSIVEKTGETTIDGVPGTMHIVQPQSLKTLSDVLRSLGCLEDDADALSPADRRDLEPLGYIDEE